MTSVNPARSNALAKPRPRTAKRVSFAEEPTSRPSHKKRYSSTIVEQDDHVPLALLAYKKGYLHHSSPALMTTASIDRHNPLIHRNSSAITVPSDLREMHSLPPRPHSVELQPRDYHRSRSQHRYSLQSTENEKPKRKQRPKSSPPTSVDNKRKRLSAYEAKQAPINPSPPGTPPVSPKKKTLLNNNWLVISFRKLIAK